MVEFFAKRILLEMYIQTFFVYRCAYLELAGSFSNLQLALAILAQRSARFPYDRSRF